MFMSQPSTSGRPEYRLEHYEAKSSPSNIPKDTNFSLKRSTVLTPYNSILSSSISAKSVKINRKRQYNERNCFLPPSFGLDIKSKPVKKWPVRTEIENEKILCQIFKVCH